MHRLAIAAALPLLANAAIPQNKLPEESWWTPDAAMIAKLEGGLKISNSLKATSYQLAQYDRYYYGVAVNGQRRVVGKLILPPNREDNPHTSLHVTEEQFMPRLQGGGCANVSVTYYVDLDFSIAQCSMADANAPLSRQPHWKPDEQTAARLEAALSERMRKAGLPELGSYERHYAGTTIDGNPMIEGGVMRAPDGIHTDSPAMHLLSDWTEEPVMADGGCNNIRLTYDVKATRFKELFCDGRGGAEVLSPDR